MDILYSASFVRQYKKLPDALRVEIKEKVRLFSDEANHQALKVHKLTGKLREQYSFSVNYHIRIVFWYTRTNPKQAVLLAIGDHDTYRE